MYSAILLLLLALAPQKDAPSGKALGTPTAPVKIEVFSDYQCPSCALLYLQTLKPLIADYVRTGKVYLVNHDFPLQMHAYSRKAALYATAAARISRFEEVENALFSKQAEWSVSGDIDKALSSVLTPAELRRVRQIAEEPQIAAEVQHEVDLGNQVKITQTPTMVITHAGTKYPIAGAVSYAVLRRFIDEFLKK